MARKSTAALSIAPVTSREVAAPPSDLTTRQAEIWRDVVESKPIEWFGPDSLPLLKEYCRAAAVCDVLEGRVAAALEGSDAVVARAYLDMRDKEAKRAALLATKLRLTQQSRYTPQASATANKRAAGRRPWE